MTDFYAARQIPESRKMVVCCVCVYAALAVTVLRYGLLLQMSHVACGLCIFLLCRAMSCEENSYYTVFNVLCCQLK